MYDVFTREDREANRVYNYTPPKPVFDAIDLLKNAEKIKRVLFKPIIDLRHLPGLNKSHENLNSLKEEVDSFITKINDNQITLENNDKRDDLLICLTEALTRIESMQTVLANFTPTPRSSNTITKQPSMTQLEINALPPEVWINVFSSLNYQDKMNMSAACKTLREGPLADTSITAYALAKQDFYSEHAFRVTDVRNAYHQAREKGKLLFFFPSEDKFRASFRQHLSKCALTTATHLNNNINQTMLPSQY